MPRFPSHPARRAALVTGASSGIGAAIASALAESGHPVVLASRRVDRLSEAAEKIRADGGEALALGLDLTDDASVDELARRAQAEMGPIEVVVSNAGEVLPAAALEVEPNDFAEQLKLNLVGAHRLVRALGPAMVERRRGDIVFVTSDVVRVPRPAVAAYMTAKHGLEGLARAMQMELEGSGVRVGIVRPGPSNTAQGSNWDPAVVEPLLAQWSRWGLMRHTGVLRPADVARAVLTAVSTPRGSHVTLLELEPEAPVSEVPEAP